MKASRRGNGHRRNQEHQRIVIERRRSSASSPHANKKVYSRKGKNVSISSDD